MPIQVAFVDSRQCFCRLFILIIGSDHYRILTMNLNNPAMFDAAGATFVAANGIVLAPDDHYDHSGSGTPATTGIGDGKTYAAIQFKFYGYMNKGLGAEWHLSDPRGMPYLAKIDILTHDKDDGDGRLVDGEKFSVCD